MSSQSPYQEQLPTAEKGHQALGLAEIEKALLGCSLDALLCKLSSSERLARLLNMIQQRYCDPDLNLTDASREAGASVSALNREIRQACGLTFYQVLRRYRVLIAVTLLASTDLPVVDVALGTGFGSVRPLERAFARLLNRSPGSLRKNMRASPSEHQL